MRQTVAQLVIIGFLATIGYIWMCAGLFHVCQTVLIFAAIIINISITLPMIIYNIYQLCKLHSTICNSSHGIIDSNSLYIIKLFSIISIAFIISWVLIYIQVFSILINPQMMDLLFLTPCAILGVFVFTMIGIEIFNIRASISSSINTNHSIFIPNPFAFILFVLRWYSFGTAATSITFFLFYCANYAQIKSNWHQSDWDWDWGWDEDT
eukprot:232067_1